jgi:type I restriction enzyme M protein
MAGKINMPLETSSTPTKKSNGSATGGGHVRQFGSFSEASNFLWSIADLLRGDYKQYDYGKVILPFTVLRRLDCVLADTKAKVLAKHDQIKGGQVKNLDPLLNRVSGVSFHNVSRLDFAKLKDDPGHIKANLTGYIKGFSENVREIFIERFKITEQIDKLDEANILYMVVSRFAEVDLHPDAVPNYMMGSIFEDLIRRFAEQSNETAGEHFTPREVIRLMVNLLFMEDSDVLRKKGVVKTLFDPACGTGGMLSVAEEYLRELNPDAHLELFGQELNDESYAICKADMLLKAENPGNVALGNSFSEDGHREQKFDYMLSNPPFGVEWKKVEKAIRDEAENLGHAGRFGAGLPRINDGSLLFIQHMISKMRPAKEGGSRIAIVFNGSPLFTGDAGSGESEIRRWIIENDWLEAIVGLPDQLFFNTGISTYIWIVTNRKSRKRKGKVQLINAVEKFQKMRKSLGNKRNELGPEHITEITEIYGAFKEGPCCKIFDNEEFGYRKITVERPLRQSFQVTSERLALLEQEAAFQNLAKSKKKGAAGVKEVEEGCELQAAILKALHSLAPRKQGETKEDEKALHSLAPRKRGEGKGEGRVWKNRALFLEEIEGAFKVAGLKLATPIEKAILSACDEQDETAEVVTDEQGRPESDPDLRDTENVPLKEDIHVYFDREVKPHVADAWIDEDKTKVGYEIPFTRHFYEYKPLRPLKDIAADIKALEGEIQGMLGEVVG